MKDTYPLGCFVPLPSARPTDVPYGYCWCGCGQQTKLAPQTAARLGWVRGEPIRYVNGHAVRGKRRVGFVVEDHGYATPCWVWQGGKTKAGWRGYGVMGNADKPGTTMLVHRYMFGLRHGQIPVELDHLCRVRACCNPDHLEPVTRLENVERGAGRRRSRCPYGHPYDGENLRLRPDGRRECRACERRRAREGYQRRKAQGSLLESIA